jgi:hypothetical protein
MKVKFLEESEITTEASLLLQAYEKQFDIRLAPPVPIDEIAECYLELDLRFDNMERRLQKKGVLGAIWIEDKRVVIDESLDPTTNPLKTGRYRFTLAHEVGHWALHRLYYLARAKQPALFGEDDEPSIICRAGDPEPIEWQANTFAAHILMPKEMVYNAWEQQHGNLRPYNATDEVKFISGSLADTRTSTVGIARDLAKQFHVSGQAMQIRLTGFGFVQLNKEASGLFDKWN